MPGFTLDPAVWVPVLVTLLGGIGWLIRWWLGPHREKEQHPQKESITENPLPQAGRDRLRLRLDENIDPDVSLFIVTFKRREPPSNISRWVDDQSFPLTADASGTFYLSLIDVGNRLREPGFPFKAYLSVPLARRDEYYARLADAEAIVTGRGEEDTGKPGNWRIWFIFPNALLHPDIEDVFRLNMKLDGV